MGEKGAAPLFSCIFEKKMTNRLLSGIILLEVPLFLTMKLFPDGRWSPPVRVSKTTRHEPALRTGEMLGDNHVSRKRREDQGNEVGWCRGPVVSVFGMGTCLDVDLEQNW